MKRIQRIFSILFALALVLAFSLVATTPVAAATPIYVNGTTGNDAWDGTSPTWVSGTIGPKQTIQAGINVVDLGGTVNVANGLYKASNTIINKSLTLQGESKAGVVIAPAANDGQADTPYGTNSQQGIIANANGVTIQNVTIDGDANNLANGGTLTNQHNFRNGILNTPDAVTGVNNLTVQNVVVRNIVRNGIFLWPQTTGGHMIANNYIENIGRKAGIYSGSAPVTITGNTIRGAGGGIQLLPLIAIASSVTLTVTDNTLYDIAGSYSLYYGYNFPSNGIYYRNPNYDEKVIITGNHLTIGNGVEPAQPPENPGVLGMYIYNADASSLIAGNTIDSTGGTKNWGIYLGGCAGTTVDSNTFTMNEKDSGIYVGRGDAGTPVPNIISNNTFTSTGSTSTSISEGSAILQSNDGVVFWMEEIPYNTDSIITGNTISGFVRGIALYEAASGTYVQPGTTVKATINYNNFIGNSLFGVDAATLSATIDATYNWWGADDGPSGVGPGSGDTVSANVLFVPWACQPTTGGLAYLTPSAGVIDDLTPVSTPPNPPATFPYGMFTFKITGLSTGQTVTLTIELPGPVPIGTKWWKYHNNTWSPMDIGDDDGDNFITVALQDGRTPDDEDLVDGQITDQGGPAYPGAVGWETYPISKVRVLLPWIVLLAAIMAGASLLVLRRRRAQS